MVKRGSLYIDDSSAAVKPFLVYLPDVRERSRLPVGQSGAAVFYGVEQEVELGVEQKG